MAPLDHATVTRLIQAYDFRMRVGSGRSSGEVGRRVEAWQLHADVVAREMVGAAIDEDAERLEAVAEQLLGLGGEVRLEERALSGGRPSVSNSARVM
jgi:hypothetical protein